MSPSPQYEFRIFGMDCADEVAILKREIGPLVGGSDQLAFDILRGKMSVLSPKAGPRAIIEAVARSGMRAEAWIDPAPGSAESSFWQLQSRSALTVLSGLLLIAGFLSHIWLAGGISNALASEGLGIAAPVPLISKILYALATLTGAWFVVPKAVFAVKRFRPDMNLLMTVAIAGAIGLGDWLEAATVAFLFSVSLALESWSVGRARRAVEALMAIAPPTVRLIDAQGGEQEVDPAQAVVGARFRVRPGERIPLDGLVTAGTSEVNQAQITGESLPVLKDVGAQVFAGTINGAGALEVEATKLVGETTLAQIIRAVGEAQSRRAPSERWVDRFAHIYTPVILGLALVIALVPPLLFAGLWHEWLYRALVLLVIGCPCALVISTPVSIVASLAAAARNGVLVKGGLHMETPAQLRAVALDKTGTVTMGRPAVTEIVAMNGHTEAEVLERLVALEAHSDHPLGRAIVSYAEQREVRAAAAESFHVLSGKGATARFDGREYWLGSHRYLEERGQETAEVHAQLDALSKSGRTVVVVGNDQHVCGFVALADTLRPGAVQAIADLRGAGIEHVVMLTGDNAGTAKAIAHQAGITELRAELLPEDKVSAVESLVNQYGKVAMVGDGINDAPAMGRASLAVAMGAAGSDTAIEAADVALMSDDLSKLPWLIGHSRRTLAIIRQNVTVSLAVKLVFVLLTFLGHASLWAAIAADIRPIRRKILRRSSSSGCWKAAISIALTRKRAGSGPFC